MQDSIRELIVFPTELSLRRFQQNEALKKGWVDASGHTTFARLRRLCLHYASLDGRPMDSVKELLLRRQAVEEARRHFDKAGPLSGLSDGALANVLKKLATELAALPEETDRMVDWLLLRSPKHKLYQLGVLYRSWRTLLEQEGYCDARDENAAILQLLKGDRLGWPPVLRDADKLILRAVRWLNPFEEACVVALHAKIKMHIESALPPAHAEVAEERLGQSIRAEIMAKPWAVWAEDLGDTLAVESPELLQLEDAARISFSRSAGAYGEIEDLARRICWSLRGNALDANRIALVVPNIGNVQDIIPHVFGRFQIPYYFRRGRPVLSSPCVKAFLSWLSFPIRPERDALIDLVRNPSIRCEDREGTVEGLLKMLPLINLGQTTPKLRGVPCVEQAFQSARSGVDALKILKERIAEPGDHFNTEALNMVAATLEKFGEQGMPLRDLVNLLEELLENANVRPRDSHEQGVWILNPHDAVGLDFDHVYFAGLNEGKFPEVPQQDALLSDRERRSLWKHLEDQGRHLPKMALPQADVLFEQQSVLFLAAIGMACGQLVFSCQSVDQEGNEKNAGEYYRKLWNLAGWCAHDDIQLNPYDQWRMQYLTKENMFLNHWKAQQKTAPEDRVPMPGESFLAVVPLPLCCARDEALQAAVNDVGQASVPVHEQAEMPAPHISHLVSMLDIEAERDVFLVTPTGEREPSRFCGHVGGMTEGTAAWFENKQELSATALELLAHCRYLFLLDKVLGLDEQRVADDAPDPMDRGTLIHSILKNIYAGIADGSAGIDAPRCWAVKTSSGWERRNEGGVGAIPLAVFVPGLQGEYEAFAEKVALMHLDRAQLGHPDVWAAEKKKVLEQVLNFVRYDVQTCADENRFPALFELEFGGETAVDLGMVRLKGMIDRIDLVFAETGELGKVRVLDYKGVSRSLHSLEEYIDEIGRNLNCQLPVYAFAAQQFLFGVFNSSATNAMTEAGYLYYQRDLKEIGKTLKKGLVPMDEPGMIHGFMNTLADNIRRLKEGDFAVDPLVETYNDWQSVCRTKAVALDDLE